MKNKMQRESTRGKSGKSWEKARWAKIEKKNQSLQIWKIFHRSFLFHTIDRKPETEKNLFLVFFFFFFFSFTTVRLLSIGRDSTLQDKGPHKRITTFIPILYAVQTTHLFLIVPSTLLHSQSLHVTDTTSSLVPSFRSFARSVQRSTSHNLTSNLLLASLPSLSFEPSFHSSSSNGPLIEITWRPVSSRKLFNIKSHQSFPPVSTLRHFTFFNNARKKESREKRGHAVFASPRCCKLWSLNETSVMMRFIS